MASLASGLWWGKLQAQRAQEGATSGADATSRLLGPNQTGWSVCWVGGSMCTLGLAGSLHISHLVWETKANNTIQPIAPRNYFHLFSPNSKQTTAKHTICKTKPYLSWSLRTHTKLPGSLRAGLLEAPPWLMTTAQDKQSCCGNNLALVKL